MISYLEEEEPDVQETARVVEEAGREAVRVPGDVRDETHCQSLVQKAVDEFGRIDVLINNAAYQMVQPGGIADITTEQFDPRPEDQPLRDVLALQGGDTTHANRREHHQHHLY